MHFSIDEIGAARLFIMSRGRGGETQEEDAQALSELLRLFREQGHKEGQEAHRAKMDEANRIASER